jgi:uncharacterized protein (DUF779 family)
VRAGQFFRNEGAGVDDRVTATAAALALLAQIVAEHGPVLFHQSGGCCDGSSPMCDPRDEFIVGNADVLHGHIGGAPFCISAPQCEAWKPTDLIIDVVPGRGGMFLARQRPRDALPDPVDHLRAPLKGF